MRLTHVNAHIPKKTVEAIDAARGAGQVRASRGAVLRVVIDLGLALLKSPDFADRAPQSAQVTL